MISLVEAAKRGITAVRQPQWAFPDTRLEITVLDDGGLGPWAVLVCPQTHKAIPEIPERQDVLLAFCKDLNDANYEPWTPKPSQDAGEGKHG